MSHYSDIEDTIVYATAPKAKSKIESLQELLEKADCSLTLDGSGIYIYDNDRDVNATFNTIEEIERVLVAKVVWLEMLGVSA
jgi:uncharacterized protein (UPF0276 family)